MPRKRFAIIFYKQVLHIHAAQLKKPVASFKIYPCFFSYLIICLTFQLN